MTSHVRRYHRRYGSSGHVWQGRYKSFLVQAGRPSAAERAAGVVQTADPLWTVIRYVERNPLRGGLVDRAEDWPWSSLAWWTKRGLAPHPSAVPVPFRSMGRHPSTARSPSIARRPRNRDGRKGDRHRERMRSQSPFRPSRFRSRKWLSGRFRIDR